MQQYIQTITRHFFRKDDLDQVAREELENFVASYPYSPAGHLLLAKKLRNSDPAAFNRQAAAASLYFTNPLWLHWMLDAPEMDVKVTEPPAANNIQQPASSAPPQLQDEPILDEEVAPVLYANAAEPAAVALGNTTPIAETFAEELPAEQSSFFAEENIPEHLSQAPESPAASSETINEPFTSESGENNIDSAGVTAPIGEPQPHEISLKQAQPGFSATTEEPEHVASNMANSETARFTPTTEEPEQDGPEVDVDDTEPSADVHIPGPKPDEQTELTIQSYHTIDYFASQGIRLRQEELLKDRFGQQVKSFTEWLRNMKRIGPPPVASQDESSNEAIREIAAHSLHGKEVITEAMAEVWDKQGNREKAIGVYEKLSLLNPSKNAYFAAKIEQLKNNL